MSKAKYGITPVATNATITSESVKWTCHRYYGGQKLLISQANLTACNEWGNGHGRDENGKIIKAITANGLSLIRAAMIASKWAESERAIHGNDYTFTDLCDQALCDESLSAAVAETNDAETKASEARSALQAAKKHLTFTSSALVAIYHSEAITENEAVIKANESVKAANKAKANTEEFIKAYSDAVKAAGGKALEKATSNYNDAIAEVDTARRLYESAKADLAEARKTEAAACAEFLRGLRPDSVATDKAIKAECEARSDFFAELQKAREEVEREALKAAGIETEEEKARKAFASEVAEARKNEMKG